MLRYLTSGESHGKCMLTIVDGMPAGLVIDRAKIDAELSRRMQGYGRGKRMKLEADKVDILSGLRKSKTIGSPIAIMVKNIDHSIDRLPAVLEPRPGHADLTGILKHDLKDVRDVLERASARDTVARVAAGALAKILLGEFGIKIISHVTTIGTVEAETKGVEFSQIAMKAEKSPVRCADLAAAALMIKEIDKARSEGDTLGGIFKVLIKGVPPGLGSYAQWDRRIDGILAKAIMSIQAIKGVSFGMGFDVGSGRGSAVHDEIFYERTKGFFRKTNNAGGIEGGMTNGEEIVIQAVMKPISTLKKPLSTIGIRTKKRILASVERSDVCAVPAAAVIGEAVSAIEIANAMLEKFGGDSILEMRRNYKGYIEQVRKF
ncbi:MAG: chorismate synthase [Omnitrophica bacterium RIFCSPLOWO2_01_FULL_45_10]|nr:MAG: chorismate synthase [Omnitrophica bacterium RIFCSPLOWO2_01_FULL_45_10]